LAFTRTADVAHGALGKLVASAAADALMVFDNVFVP
jgi:hypothetical protein